MRRALSLLAVASLAVVATAWQRAVNQLQQDGKTISTNLRMVDGTLMVPVKDVASYLGGDLKVQDGTATIGSSRGNSPAGAFPYSANMPGMAQPFINEVKAPEPTNLNVKVGEAAVSGGFALTVQGIDLTDKRSYKTQLDPRGRSIRPSLKDDRLVVVRMRLENRNDDTRRPPLPAASNVTLFDENGVGVPAIAFDARPLGNPDLSDDLAPFDTIDAPLLASKGSFEFAVVFSLPKDRAPKRVAVALPPASSDAGGANVTVSVD